MQRSILRVAPGAAASSTPTVLISNQPIQYQPSAHFWLLPSTKDGLDDCPKNSLLTPIQVGKVRQSGRSDSKPAVAYSFAENCSGRWVGSMNGFFISSKTPICAFGYGNRANPFCFIRVQ